MMIRISATSSQFSLQCFPVVKTSSSRASIDAEGERLRHRDNNLKRYAITSEIFNAISEAQGHCCRVCGTHRDAVKDNPVLRAQVRAFVGQEAMHGRQHRALNERLQTLGYPTEHADRAIGRACDRILKLRPNTLAVAATAAAEHLTGVFAAVVLSDDRTRHLLFSQPEVEPLIAWHALEELEHKNVAFDVMTTVGVRYPTRIAGFLVTISMLATVVTQQWIAALIGMHSELTWKQRRRFIHNLRRQRLLHPSFVIETLKYLRPGFHPDDTNTDHLVRQWRARLINEGAIRENRSPAA